jgi:hypothetical protein
MPLSMKRRANVSGSTAATPKGLRISGGKSLMLNVTITSATQARTAANTCRSLASGSVSLLWVALVTSNATTANVPVHELTGSAQGLSQFRFLA